MNKLHISIFASIGAQNLGDELILKNEIIQIENIFQKNNIYGIKTEFLENYFYKKNAKNISFKVFSYDKNSKFFKKENVFYANYFPNGIRKLKNFLKNFLGIFSFLQTLIFSDLIIIGGGGIIYDSEKQSGNKTLDQWILRIKFLNFFRKKYIFWGIGIDIKDEKNLEKLKKIFSKSKEIFVRDSHSLEILNHLKIPAKIIKDPVFYDNFAKLPEKSSKITKINPKDFRISLLEKIDFKNKNVGISLRKGYLSQTGIKNMENLIIKEIISYIKNEGGKIIFLNHSFHKEDEIANDENFINSLDLQDIYSTKNMSETYEFYKEKKVDLCISMRLHSMILCEVYEIPYIGLSYAKKTDFAV